MSNSTKSQTGESACPNCSAVVNIPKSTRSIICKSCDAIIKIVGTEAGDELKIVGRSVEENPTYQQIEAQVADLKREIAEMHAEYEREVSRPVEPTLRRLGWFGVAVAVPGSAAVLVSATAGAGALAAGVALAVTGFVGHRRRKRERATAATEISKAIERLGAQRDMLQRKAARLKTEV